MNKRKNSIKLTQKDSSDSIKMKNSKERSHFKGQRFLRSYDIDQRQQSNNLLVDLQNLDIEPIQNINGDKFYIGEVQENNASHSSHYPQQHTVDNQDNQNNQQQVQFIESIVWPDVFYGKKNIISLLQQRNNVCQMYNLNSKSLKQSQPNKRVYNDAQIVQFVKQLLSESPSYGDYDSMCFTIIPEMGLNNEKYFVFMGSDLKFVPQCKVCNFAAYLILNVQKKFKNAQTLTYFSNSPFIKGKIICSDKNCKKSLLGEFIMSHNDQKDKTHKTQTKISNFRPISNQNCSRKELITDKKSQKKIEKKPELSEKQKMLIKKTALRINA